MSVLRSVKLKTLASVAFVLLAAEARAGYVGLPSDMGTLTTDGNYTSVGTYTFTFSNYVTTTNGGVTVPPGSVAVSALTGAITGFQISGPLSAKTNPPPGGSQNDISFAYTVSTTGPGILAVSLNTNGATHGGGTAEVVETIYTDASRTTALGQLVSNSFGTVTLSLSGGSAADGGYTSLYIIKDIMYDTYAPGDTASYSVIAQTFAVPEPSSMVLAGMGFAGLAIAARRRARAAKLA